MNKIVREIINHEDTSGYLGPIRVQGNPLKGKDVFIIWAYGETLNALIQYYNYTNNKKVLDALVKAADQVVKIPRAEFESILSNQDWYTSICNFFVDLYEITNEKKYMELAEFILYHFISDLIIIGIWSPEG